PHTPACPFPTLAHTGPRPAASFFSPPKRRRGTAAHPFRRPFGSRRRNNRKLAFPIRRLNRLCPGSSSAFRGLFPISNPKAIRPRPRPIGAIHRDRWFLRRSIVHERERRYDRLLGRCRAETSTTCPTTR